MNAPSTTPAALERRSRLIKLDSNENPFGPSPRAVDAMRAVLNSANFYPDDDCSQLRQKLATHYGLPAEQVLVTAGSTAMLSLLCQTLLAPGLNAVTSERSFIVYSMAVQSAGAHLVEAPMPPGENSFDLNAIFAAIDANTRIVFLPNPNNPTGTMLEADVVERFLVQVPSHVVVVLDELTTSSRCIFRSCGITSIRTRWSISARAQAWLCCEHSRRRTALQLCAWATAWAQRNCWDTARACATHFLCLQWRKPRRSKPSMTRIIFSALWRTMFCSRGFSLRVYRPSVIASFQPLQIFCSAILAKMLRLSLIDYRMRELPCARWGRGERGIAFAWRLALRSRIRRSCRRRGGSERGVLPADLRPSTQFHQWCNGRVPGSRLQNPSS